jgi:hypothetical protein
VNGPRSRDRGPFPFFLLSQPGRGEPAESSSAGSDLEDLVREKFASQRAFCKATGLSEDMLSHVLAGRKDLSLARLTAALARIGYVLRIVPMPECAHGQKRKQTG